MENSSKTKFSVVGFMPSTSFQRCRFYVEKLHQHFPDLYEKPAIRAMLNVAWEEYLTMVRREFGGKAWTVRSVIVFENGDLLGDQTDLLKRIAKSHVFRFNIDFERVACQQLLNYIEGYIKTYDRQFVYINVAINNTVIGSMLFLLYNDLVPLTCMNFLMNCNSDAQPIFHRVVKDGWVQFKGVKFHPMRISHENYVVPHDRRGVLSLVKERDHHTTQFFVTLTPAPWMDYKFVAFGQLVQGGEVLRRLEMMSTYYQTPVQRLTFAGWGEYKLDANKAQLNAPIDVADDVTNISNVDVCSVLNMTRFIQGKYCLDSDLRCYLQYYPLSLPDYLYDRYGLGGEGGYL